MATAVIAKRKCGHIGKYSQLRHDLEQKLLENASRSVCDTCKQSELEAERNIEAMKKQRAEEWVKEHGIKENVTIDSSVTYGDFVEVRIFVKVTA